MSGRTSETSLDGIAVIGLAGKFPGARDIDQFWDNLRHGRESIRFFTETELRASEPDYDSLKAEGRYVPARGFLEGIEEFDAKFFKFNPKEARLMDPQHRLWLECAWEALENAGYDPERCEQAIGVFAGGSFLNSYLLYALCQDRRAIEQLVRRRNAESFLCLLHNSIGFLPTRTSYAFDLKGPSLNVQTACSTSLVAVCLACQSLSTFDSDICLAGGVSIVVPQDVGYVYEPGGIPSPDGHCRPFDAAAQGTVSGNGLGIVVLKRLEDALADGDRLLAVIKGWAMNNDGSGKVSYSAPSIDGQAEVIAMAQALAGFEPESISYIEAHGTATSLGDPAEVEALCKAFRSKTEAKQFCGLGSVKSNIGHLDAAAGVAGLIKTILALRFKEIPPSLHYTRPNPEIDFPGSPFYVVDRLQPWTRSNGQPRRAGVSSFGIGGTNAHVVLEEAPEQSRPAATRDWQLLVLSARTQTALARRSQQLADYLDTHPGTSLADTAYTLSVGRAKMQCRRFLACRNHEHAAMRLRTETWTSAVATDAAMDKGQVVFMFPGQGSEYPGMGAGLYASQELFRQLMDRCLVQAGDRLGMDLSRVLYPRPRDWTWAAQQLARQSVAQTAIFATEYCLARQLMSWGIQPSACVGHSIGEYTAACLAGVLSLEDAITLVAARGRLMETMPPGIMLAVSLSEQEVRQYLSQDVELAVVNGPSLCALSGSVEAMHRLEQQLAACRVEHKRLRVGHAFHSHMIEPILEPFRTIVQTMSLTPPAIPMLSNLTGSWTSDGQIADPEYWVQHLRHTVRFSDCMAELAKGQGRIHLEVGPGRTLKTLTQLHARPSVSLTAIATMPQAREDKNDLEVLLEAVGALWGAGYDPDWQAFFGAEGVKRVALPTYPFERKGYWVEPERTGLEAVSEEQRLQHGGERGALEEAVEGGNALQTQIEGPAVSVEQRLLDIWRDLLGHDQISEQDSFFDLGGHSLIAVRLFSRIEKEFQKRLPLATLIDNPTIGQLAAVIQDDAGVSWESLVPFREHGSRPPFFCVHSEGGNVLEYVRLSECLNEDVPFFALQAYGLKGDRIVFLSVEEMAKRYLVSIRRQQPHGPYYLGGYCLGGLVAFEMTRQLEAAGEKVAFLGMISCINPLYLKRRMTNLPRGKKWLYRLYERIELESDNVSCLSNRQKAAYLRERWRRMLVLSKVGLEGAMRWSRDTRGKPQRQASRPYILEQVRQAQNKAFYMYEPQPIKTPITLFRVSRYSRLLCQDPLLGWSELSANGVEEHEVNGFHKNVLKDPYVAHLGVMLDICMHNSMIISEAMKPKSKYKENYVVKGNIQLLN
jgi:acyl transferase domain-containing protein/thioesterase domain-containing protein